MADAPTTKGEKQSVHEMENEPAKGDGGLKGVAPEQRELYLQFQSKDDEWKEFHSKKLLRRLDFRLLPLIVLMYLLNFLDRSNLAQARLGTLEEDLGMDGTDFNLATSIFFVGYLLMQLPSNLILTRVRPSLYLGSCVMLWGVVSTAQSSVKNFGSLVAARVCLGIAEAPFFPGTIMLMSSWYTRRELTVRIAWFYSGNALANMFGGLLGAGVLGNLHNAQGIAGWRWLFIIEGVITIGVALVAMVILPDFPGAAKWLSDEERQFAQWRLVDDAKESDDSQATTIMQGLKVAVMDPRLYIFVLLQHLSLLSQTFQYFFPSIVETLGFDNNIVTLLLTVPVWFATFLTSLFVTWTSGKTGDRSIHIIALMMVSCLGNVIATAASQVGARFFAMFLMPMGAVAAYQIILSWVANSFPRPMIKRSAVIAICNMIGNTSSIYGSYMYPESSGPQYVPGGSTNSVICLLVASIALIIRLIHIRANKKLEKAENEAVEQSADGEARGEGFRYVL
ncbi:hypothetical protein FQN54_000009 [Arachnomyces sp. PD_36]|nr:hypothetical protein FQN54_000009 [Arachnomyces sp. PD_36]